MIRTREVECCPQCGSSGESLYVGLSDRLFNAPGIWGAMRCNTKSCQMVWLNPAPINEDLHLAYTSYYTHVAADKGNEKIKISSSAWQGYRSWVWGNTLFPATFWQKALGLIFFLSPNRKLGVEYPIRQLEGINKGRLLEIGCGAGGMLRSLTDLGWETVGIDFDENAVLAAQRQDLDARTGDLANQNFSEGSFDVVLMNHVIEHLPDPVATLKGIDRILRNGGRLVGLTPNANSWGHEYFKQDWYALHPPQHLQIFTKSALSELLKRAGFERVQVDVSALTAIAILTASMSLKKRKANFSAMTRVAMELVWMWEWLVTKFGKESGELLVFVGQKNTSK